jgi:anti-sigma B factor antagonist
MKPENPAGVGGSRVTPVTAVGDKSLKLSLDAQTGGAVVLRCEGRIIFGPEARALTEIVAEAMPSARRMVVDLTGVESVDSAGLGELVLLHMWAGAAGYDLKFAAPRKSVRQLLELTNLLSVFDVHESVAEAVAAMHEQVCSG